MPRLDGRSRKWVVRCALAPVVLSVVTAACYRIDNPQSCALAANQGSVLCTDGGTHGGQCKTAGDCTAMPGFPQCDTSKLGGICVQCIAGHPDACKDTTPRCDTTLDSCVACVDDGDCGGTGVCLASGPASGSCAPPSTIIHVSVNAPNDAQCIANGVPCSLTTALSLATPQQNVIKLDDDGPYTNTMPLTIANDVTIDARGLTGARIERTGVGGGPIMMIGAGRTVTILGGVVQGNTNANDDGIKCTQANLTIIGSTITSNDLSGITTDTCTLYIASATINNNSQRQNQSSPAISTMRGALILTQSQILSNLGGGLFVMNGTFTVVGNVFASNNQGQANSLVGGVAISASVDPTNRLDFNTIANNQVPPMSASPGIQCAAGAFIARNNIVWNNMGATNNAQVGGTCQHAYSDIEQSPVPGDPANNIDVNPMFNTNFSVMTGSPVAGKADPNSDLTGIAAKDILGQPRTKPADLGAYNVPAQ